MKKNRKKWDDVIRAVAIELPNPISFNCPSCKSTALQYQYVGDPTTRLGYLVIWCSNCLRGIYLSRVQAPEYADMLSFDDDDKVQKRIPFPNINWVNS